MVFSWVLLPLGLSLLWSLHSQSCLFCRGLLVGEEFLATRHLSSSLSCISSIFHFKVQQSFVLCPLHRDRCNSVGSFMHGRCFFQLVPQSNPRHSCWIIGPWDSSFALEPLFLAFFCVVSFFPHLIPFLVSSLGAFLCSVL